MDKLSLNSIKESIVFIPLISGYFLLYGAISLITYYREFNIDIIDFIEFSELIVYFIKDIFTILLNLVTGLIGFLIGINLFLKPSFTDLVKKSSDSIQVSKTSDELIDEGFSELLNKLKNKESYTSEDLSKIEDINAHISLMKSRKEDQSAPDRRKYIIVFLIILIIVGFGISFLIYSSSWNNLYQTIIVYALTILLAYFIGTKSYTYFLIAQSFCAILIYGYFGTLEEAQNVKYRGKNNGIALGINDSIPFESDSTNYYIGKTNKYVFLFKNNAVLILPNDQIKWFKFPKVDK